MAASETAPENQKVYFLDTGIRLLLLDLKIPPANVLRRAGLAADLLTRGQTKLSEDDYFSLWAAIEAEAGDEALPARIGEAISVEYFSPPLLAAVSSTNLEAAAKRIATFKQLVGPLRLSVTRTPDALRLAFDWQSRTEPPRLLVLSEIAFWVALARIGTRTRVAPDSIVAPISGSPQVTEFLGCPITTGPSYELVFSPEIAELPFVTSNEPMWNIFEPELQSRLTELDNGASMEERVQAVLVDLLPAGSSTMKDVARSLAVSTRTLQRRLMDEGTTFQEVLGQTRESLAQSYLEQPDIPAAQISFLLGYENQSSFYRAFHQWTGMTPEAARTSSAAL